MKIEFDLLENKKIVNFNSFSINPVITSIILNTTVKIAKIKAYNVYNIGHEKSAIRQLAPWEWNFA